MTHDLGKRVIAYILDSIIVGIASSILQVLMQLTVLPSNNGISFEFNSGNVLSIGLYIAYFVLFAVLKDGKTIGKMAMNLEIRYENGDKIPQDKLIIREILKSVLMPIGLISFLIVVFREDNKSIHDLVSNTMVYTSESLNQVNKEQPLKEQDEKDPYDNYYD